MRTALVVFMVAWMVVGGAVADGVGLPRTASGCVWPTGVVDNPSRGGRFLQTGFEGYIDGCYHLGKDVMVSAVHPDHAKVDDPVYAVCDGEIVLINASDSWGKGNCAVLIRHQFRSGVAVACYGHLQTSSVHLSLGKSLQAGYELGRIGQWVVNGKAMPHLHFGVHPGELASINLHRLGLEYLPKGWHLGQPLDGEGWVDPIAWIETQQPINETGQANGDSHPAWDLDASRLYFLRSQQGAQSVWVCDENGGYSRPIWSIPTGQLVTDLLRYKGLPLTVLWTGSMSKLCQPNRTIRAFPGQGQLSQTLYDPNDDWSWTTASGRVIRFWPDGSREQVATQVYQSGAQVSSVPIVYADGRSRAIPVIVKKGPKTPWDQFSWTCRSVFPEELPVIVLESGELWWVTMTAKYNLPDYEQTKVVEIWTTNVARLTTFKTHGSVSGFSMANPQRLFATSGGNIWRLDFGADGTEWRQITGGQKIVRQATKIGGSSSTTKSLPKPLEELTQKVQGLLDKIKLPWKK